MDPRAELIKRATERTPLTAEGLPIGVYRADLVPGQENPQTPTKDEELEHAFQELEFHEGFPALPGGHPLWHKWDFEPIEAFNCFGVYLAQIESGPRSLSFLTKVPEVRSYILESNGHGTNSSPQPPMLASEIEARDTKVVFESLTNWYYTFYWQQRAKAHDLFREAAYRQIRVRRAMSCENHHYEVCENLLGKVVDYMKSEEFWEELSPKEAINLFKVLTVTQRISAGLPAANPLAPTAEGFQTTDFELIMRTVAQRNQGTRDLYQEDGAPIQEEARLALEGLLGDPQQTRLMQEMIIRVHDNRREARGLPSGSASRIREVLDAEVIQESVPAPGSDSGGNGDNRE